jgi:hypothetical protein
MTIRVSLRERAALQLEILALRHQLHVVTRSRPQRLRLTPADRMLWVWLSKRLNGWRAAIVIVKPETVFAWHRRGFRLFWTWKSRRHLSRPSIPPDARLLPQLWRPARRRHDPNQFQRKDEQHLVAVQSPLTFRTA